SIWPRWRSGSRSRSAAMSGSTSASPAVMRCWNVSCATAIRRLLPRFRGSYWRPRRSTGRLRAGRGEKRGDAFERLRTARRAEAQDARLPTGEVDHRRRRTAQPAAVDDRGGSLADVLRDVLEGSGILPARMVRARGHDGAHAREDVRARLDDVRHAHTD